MAAGSGAASGHGARSSSAALEATLDRRFQGVSNTMESIQGLSTWCIENKKHHALIVRYWMKWLKKSDNNHRLNLFYLANDVIQNCKRKNAVVFRSSFGDVLPSAAQFVRDGKVRKSVERIFSIWEERSVYPEEVIAQFKAGLNRKEKERERPKEKEKDKDKEKEKEKEKVAQLGSAPTNTKAALKSKIVAEFTPHSLVEQLSRYRQVVAEEELREKQLGSLRVDACSTEALKRLKDKAEGNKFAKDFEDNNEKLQEFVAFLDKELKTAPPLLEALGNADIFYEMQYKEVKIVANAYNAFANRVASLKRKLDLLKPTLPGPEDSPIPSPSEDAPSPTGSDSPFLNVGVNSAQVDPELDGKAMDDGEMHSDNRDMEDMDVSDEEAADEKKDKGSNTGTAVAKATKVDAAPKTPTTPTKAAKVTAATSTLTPSTSAAAQSAATAPLGVSLEKVDLGKISSILSSLTSAMKNTAASPAPSSTGTPTTPSGPSAASKVTPSSPALASILSRVDITPEGILNALSKSNSPGLSSLLHSVTNTSSAPPTKTSPESSSSSSSSASSSAAAAVKTLLSPSAPKAKPLLGNSFKRDTPSHTDRQLSPPPPPPPPLPPRPSGPSVSPPSLESKINSFLQGNPGFSLALGDMSPDGVDGTPVRDEGAGTPTQDEMMDPPSAGGLARGHSLSPTAYRSDPWDAVITPSGSSGSNGDLNGSSAARFGPGGKKGVAKDGDGVINRLSSPPSRDPKGRRDGEHGPARLMASRMSTGSRKADGSGAPGNKAEDKRKGQETGGEQDEGRYHRIETLVSPCAEGAPIQALKYSNRPVAGERIKTVESIRVIGRGSRREGGAGGRPGGGPLWFEDEAAAYMEQQPPTPPRTLLPPHGEDGIGSGPPPVSPHLLLPPHLHPPPPHAIPPQGPFPPLPYHLESMPTPPPPLLLPHPSSSSSPFLTSPPPIPRPPPPPLQQQLSPSPVPSAVMVGGVLVPVDLPLAAARLDADRGRAPLRGGSKAGPPPLMSSLLGEPPKLPRKGTVKEAFGASHHHHHHHHHHQQQQHYHQRHHRHHPPGGPSVPVPLLGRVKESLSLPLPSPSPTSSTTPPSTPSSPALDAPAAPPLLKPPGSPPAPPRSQPASGPVPLLNLPTTRPPFLSLPVPQRPLLRGRAPTGGREFSHGGGGFRGAKRSGPPFSGGSFHGQKRPYLPPRY